MHPAEIIQGYRSSTSPFPMTSNHTLAVCNSYKAASVRTSLTTERYDIDGMLMRFGCGDLL
jgi:hypothetical protein